MCAACCGGREGRRGAAQLQGTPQTVKSHPCGSPVMGLNGEAGAANAVPDAGVAGSWRGEAIGDQWAAAPRRGRWAGDCGNGLSMPLA